MTTIITPTSRPPQTYRPHVDFELFKSEFPFEGVGEWHQRRIFGAVIRYPLRPALVSLVEKLRKTEDTYDQEGIESKIHEAMQDELHLTIGAACYAVHRSSPTDEINQFFTDACDLFPPASDLCGSESVPRVITHQILYLTAAFTKGKIEEEKN